MLMVISITAITVYRSRNASTNVTNAFPQISGQSFNWTYNDEYSITILIIAAAKVVRNDIPSTTANVAFSFWNIDTVSSSFITACMYWEFDWLIIKAYPASVKPITVGAIVNERDINVLATAPRGIDVVRHVTVMAIAKMDGN